MKKRFLERLDAVGSVSAVARELGMNRNTAFSLAYKVGMKFGGTAVVRARGAVAQAGRVNSAPLRLVVGPPSRTGGRRVRAGAEILGIAHRPEDVIEFARRAGLEDVELTDPVIEWHGGGPDVWD